jgi:hypothetical protein
VPTIELRDRDAIARDLVGVAGLTAVLVGLTVLAPTKEIGFDPQAALDGIAAGLPVTLPATVLIAIVAVLDLAVGLAIARFIRRSAFDSVGDAVLAAVVASAFKDLVLFAVLGQLGWFRAPILWLVDGALLVAIWRLRPLLAMPVPRPSLERLGSIPFVLLVAVVWAGPIMLMLASPVVPFLDVLPNHVAPAEHLRTFGSFNPLTATQSPIYGPSRTLLGYVALLGTLTTMSGLPAGLALSAFILPSTILVAIGAYRLATVAAGNAAGPWALLAFALTGSFARLSDDRATVVVLPFVIWSLCFFIGRVRDPAMADDRSAAAPDARTEGRTGPGSWRLSDGVLLGLGLGGAIFVHPIIGALTVGTVLLVAVVLPDRAGRIGLTGVVTAALVAVPQLTTMLGLPFPTSFAIAGVPAGILVGEWMSRRDRLHRPILRVARWSPILLVPIGLLVAWPFELSLDQGPVALIQATELLLVAAIIGALLDAPGARSPVVLAGVAVGLLVAIGTQLYPTHGTGLLGQALRFELPKTLYYWLPAIVAIGAAAGLAWTWQAPSLPWLGRVGAVGVFVVVAALPLRGEPIDAFHLGEHRFSESLAIDLRWAGTGYWTGFPDTRQLVDPPRQALIEAVRSEIAAGRIAADTPVLHVAVSFQQWVATPLGVFTGVTETDVSPDAEHSIHTVGGRLEDFDQLAALVSSGAYPYLLFEPNEKLSGDLPATFLAAGYIAIFTNGQGTLYHLEGA